MVGLLGRDDRRVAREHEVDARVRHQVRLELRDVDIEGTVKAQGGSQGGDDLRQEAIQVGVRGPFNVQIAAADVVQSLVVHHDGHVGVLQKGVHAEHGVVGLDNGRGHLGACPDGEGKLRLLAVVDREALQHQAAEAGAGAAAAGVEDHEALQPRAVVRELPDPVEHEVNDLLADGVVPAGKVVRSVFLPRDKLLRMKELPVGAGANLVHHRRLEVHEDAPRHVLSRAGLAEEGVEGVVTAANGLVAWHLAVGLDSVLEAEQLPTSIADLDATLADMDTDAFAHGF
mmetsp:Transcript_107338/g.336332  ORF Transcript_107338/g.336332 Transcript_107338/m.336332 type:complete len:286 (-) Transcript_107338:35-892(-)